MHESQVFTFGAVVDAPLVAGAATLHNLRERIPSSVHRLALRRGRPFGEARCDRPPQRSLPRAGGLRFAVQRPVIENEDPLDARPHERRPEVCVLAKCVFK